ncbi:hypothetical protein SAMN05421805_102505 [Saccharopolyspora antimicrobica]|uniref:ATP-grasp domain-containing protein n=1 Tax=Saccharopolyspora antimicrobica TaxID=455193 RepID=A0A1I4W2G3_9PSEU|nr:hypothetical protein [Saccharopolyspora antimicrobica]RKT87094.1 hypothetical protein ATL45_5482 [Saccharopolyspora antimicrobica]SFN07784.1 hypothetical protein SAMN05421805_102505 [Saccharopolyspora antimicrobica]
MNTVHFGTFNAERFWRPPDLAELPAVRTGGDAVVATMDELLVAGCASGDLLITRRPLSPAVQQCLAEAEIHFDHRSAANVESPGNRGSVEGHPVERLLLGDRTLAAHTAGCDQVRPYAVLPDTVSLLTHWGRPRQVPSSDVVTRVNTKTWSNTLLQKLGLPGCARVVRSVDELPSAVRDCGPTVVVKDPYGVSGRGTIRISSPGVLRAIQRVLRRQEAEGRRIELLVQPEFSKRCDFSGHLRLDRDGTARFLGVQVMVNHGFRHVGSGPAGPELLSLLDRHGYRDVLAEVGTALAAEGYWGPVGVDSMLLDNNTLLPVLEINARSSLGLLTLLAGRRAAHTGLACHLWQLGLTVGSGRGVEDVVAALRKAQVLYRGGTRSGVLVLGGSSLSEPDGRMYGLSYCVPGDAPLWQGRVVAAVRAAGMRPRYAGHAA